MCKSFFYNYYKHVLSVFFLFSLRALPAELAKVPYWMVAAHVVGLRPHLDTLQASCTLTADGHWPVAASDRFLDLTVRRPGTVLTMKVLVSPTPLFNILVSLHPLLFQIFLQLYLHFLSPFHGLFISALCII